MMRRSARFIWALVALIFGVYVTHALTGCTGNDERVVGSSNAAVHVRPASDGQKLYLTYCLSCHQANGQGVSGVFPPLDGSEWVTDDERKLVQVILHGLTGPIEVKENRYVGAMPPWGTALKDEEVAAVATYVRASWTNAAAEISATEVARIRKEFAGRKQPWTAEELGLVSNSK